MNIFLLLKVNKILIEFKNETEKLEDVKSHPLSPSIQSGSSFLLSSFPLISKFLLLLLLFNKN